jgi:hypothetical protein
MPPESACADTQARNSLEPRRDPYWVRLSQGKYLGYRKMAAGGAVVRGLRAFGMILPAPSKLRVWAILATCQKTSGLV